MSNIKMTVDMEVTVPQALALQAMFNYWNSLSSMGSSRKVSFFVDGDGDFHPNCVVKFSEEIPELNDEIKRLVISGGISSGDLFFDYVSVAWYLEEGNPDDRTGDVREIISETEELLPSKL